MKKIIKNRTYIKNLFLYVFIISLGLIAPLSVDIPKVICGLGIVVLSILYKDKIVKTIQENRIYFWGIQAFVLYILLLILFGWLFIKSIYKPTFSDIEMMLTFFTLLSFFALLVSIETSIKIIKKTLFWFAVSVAINGVFVLFFIYGYKEFFTHPIDTLNLAIQQRFTMTQNVLGKNIFTKDYSLFFGIAAIVSFYLFIFSKKWFKILLLLVFFLNLFFLMITVTRGSIIGVFIGMVPLLILFFKQQKKIYNIIYLLVILMAICFLIFNLPESISNRFHEIPSETNAFMQHGEDEGSASTRLRIWQIIFSHSNEFWLFGNNPLYANNILHQYFREAGHQDYVDMTHLSHNVYLSYWLKGGIVSLLFLLFCLWYPSIKMICKKQFSYFGIAVILFLSIVGMEDRYFGDKHKPAMLLFFLFFLTFNLIKLFQLEQPKKSLPYE